MSFGADVRRRLQLAAVGCAVLLVTLLVLVAAGAPFLLEADLWIGEPVAGLARDSGWLEDLALVVAALRARSGSTWSPSRSRCCWSSGASGDPRPGSWWS